MTAKKPVYGDAWDDKDKRMNRRVRIVSIIDPKGREVNPYVTVRNVGEARPGEPAEYPSPIGRTSVMRLESLRRRFKYVEEVSPE